MLRFLRNCRCSPLRAALSSSLQNGCPTYVVGTSDPASTSAEMRGSRPVASARPPTSWVAALMRTSFSGSSSPAFATSSGRWPGLRSASIPPAMNMLASSGRARVRVGLTTVLRYRFPRAYPRRGSGLLECLAHAGDVELGPFGQLRVEVVERLDQQVHQRPVAVPLAVR